VKNIGGIFIDVSNFTFQKYIFKILEYGDRENQDLGKRFDIESDDFPVYKLFKGDPSAENAIPYEGTKKNRVDILMFLKTNGIYVGLPTCIELFDEFASEFLEGKDQEKTIADAETEVETITDKLQKVHKRCT
jgi:hypothetical protein